LPVFGGLLELQGVFDMDFPSLWGENHLHVMLHTLGISPRGKTNEQAKEHNPSITPSAMDCFGLSV
jgi:hypothetical protein